MKVLLRTDIDSPSGYSVHARGLIKSLLQIEEVDLKLEQHKHDSSTITFSPAEAELYQDLTAKEWTKPDILIHFETPEFYQPMKGCYNIGFTVWETTRIPSTNMDGQPRLNWVHQMNRMNEIWTASKDAEIAFAESGVKSPVMVFNGPIDTDFYKPGLPELPISGLTVDMGGQPIKRDTRPFVIGFMGQWTKRKNIEDWLFWVMTQFKKNEAVGLLKTYGSHLETNQQDILDRVQNVRRAIRMDHEGADVIVMTEKLTDLQIARWFQSVDLYASFSRGEGYALPVAQAMASGCVVMHTAWGGPSDYIEQNRSGYLVPCNFEPVTGMPHNPWYRADQWWARADLKQADEFAHKLLGERNSTWHQYLSKNARLAVIEKCSIAKTAVLIAERLATLYNQGLVKA